MGGVSSFRRILSPIAVGASAGILAAFWALAVAELVAGLVRPAAGPVTAVGGAVIDRTPAAVKDFAIRTFGEDDKAVLRLGILAVLAVAAVGLGVLALSHRRAGAAGVLLFGIVGSAAALGRPDSAGIGDALPSTAGALAGAVALYVLASKAVRVPAPAPGDGEGRDGTEGWSRRGFLAAAGVTAAAAASAGSVGRFLTGRRGRGAVASRRSLVLPAPASPAPAVPAGVQLEVAGISPFTTPNSDFYRVDTALAVPRVDAGTWRLRIHGAGVSRPRVHTLDQLLARPLIERDITLTCVSNEVGGPYTGTARWLGVPLAGLLEEAGVRPPSEGGKADQLVARSVDGMTLGSPVEDVMDGRDAMLAVGMNGEPLPFDHGFPVRMVVPGLYGYVSACKWITDIKLTTFDAYDPYWVRRTWARRAPVKTQARIDTPKPFARPAAGKVTVAGVAWAQHRGISRVEVRVDDGPWQDADLAPQATADTWRQWSFPWRATPGGHTITVRATDGSGQVQSEQRTRTVPDGASGWHSVFVTVP
ncbi:molybdopterin-binding oxidoreductase [Streptomyces sp. WAC07149]|uniref:molybdopterin-dependent oxidoreductase n=1 Tax=Streptomyces sp. WAC07149 TaxID=2487425 RepID=UPI000F7AE339|nr:molybdopterin-dependent oxidoreductase [Streptomyces sp. WAC07149]RST04420.1 molybdopterin-binding oxidoreductase [Streptomyces sp. WAC07149]